MEIIKMLCVRKNAENSTCSRFVTRMQDKIMLYNLIVTEKEN